MARHESLTVKNNFATEARRTPADDMEWPVGELIVKANELEVRSLNELKKILNKNKNGKVLLECRNGRIGYFQLEE